MFPLQWLATDIQGASMACWTSLSHELYSAKWCIVLDIECWKHQKKKIRVSVEDQ